MKKIHKIEISVALGLIVSMIISIAGFGADCKKIRDEVVRLHVLANSDSEDDQKVKLAVRDALLECGAEIFSGSLDKNNAAWILESEEEKLTEIANEVLKENGFDYSAKIYLVNEYFNTRVYDNFTMPAGEYLALKVVLGNGEGKNWWCVMFPPLCLPAATEQTNTDAVFNENEIKIIKEKNGYEIRFKIVEIIESIIYNINK